MVVHRMLKSIHCEIWYAFEINIYSLDGCLTVISTLWMPHKRSVTSFRGERIEAAATPSGCSTFWASTASLLTAADDKDFSCCWRLVHPHKACLWPFLDRLASLHPITDCMLMLLVEAGRLPRFRTITATFYVWRKKDKKNMNVWALFAIFNFAVGSTVWGRRGTVNFFQSQFACSLMPLVICSSVWVDFGWPALILMTHER